VVAVTPGTNSTSACATGGAFVDGFRRFFGKVVPRRPRFICQARSDRPSTP
jgi:hypothetical protein